MATDKIHTDDGTNGAACKRQQEEHTSGTRVRPEPAIILS